MKRVFLMVLVALCVVASLAMAKGTDTVSVHLNPGQSAIVSGSDEPMVTYRVTDVDMARWAKMHTKPHVIYRDRYVTTPAAVIHDTTYVAAPHALWPGTRGIMPDWWPLLFILGFLILLAALLAGSGRGRDGRDGQNGRDGRDAVASHVSNTPGGNTGGIARPWLMVGDSMPAGTTITINRPSPQRK